MIFKKKRLFNCVTEQMYIIPRKIISNSSASVPSSYKSLKVKASKVHRLLLSFTRKSMKVKKWSLQWTQFLQLCKEAWKKFRSSMGFKPMTSRLPVQCSTNWAIKPLTLGAGQLWVHLFQWKKWVLMIYEINHIWTVEMKWKWRNDRRSERNLCNCVKKPEKKKGLQRGLNAWPCDYRCNALPTELWSHWRWEQVNCGMLVFARLQKKSL